MKKIFVVLFVLLSVVAFAQSNPTLTMVLSQPSTVTTTSSTGATTSLTNTVSVTISITSGLQITAPSCTTPPCTLPAAIVSQPYSTTLTAQGGTAPYVWAISSGTLPTGLTLVTNADNSGTIAGTIPSTACPPPGPCTDSFTIQVTDSTGKVGTLKIGGKKAKPAVKKAPAKKGALTPVPSIVPSKAAQLNNSDPAKRYISESIWK